MAGSWHDERDNTARYRTALRIDPLHAPPRPVQHQRAGRRTGFPRLHRPRPTVEGDLRGVALGARPRPGVPGRPRPLPARIDAAQHRVSDPPAGDGAAHPGGGGPGPRHQPDITHGVAQRRAKITYLPAAAVTVTASQRDGPDGVPASPAPSHSIRARVLPLRPVPGPAHAALSDRPTD